MMRDAGPSRQPDDPTRRAAECAQAEEVLATYRRVFGLIATRAPIGEVLETIVGAIDSCCTGAIGAVLLLDEDREHLHHGAAPNLPEAYVRAVDGTRIGPRAGSFGTAAHREEPVVVEDVARDPIWENHRDLAEAYGLRACAAHPVFSTDGRVLGALAAYYREPRRPGPHDLKFIEAVAQLAGIAVERHRAERQRRAAERRLLAQKTVLVELAKSEPLGESDFKAFCRSATEAAAGVLQVERVSVWLFNDERTALRCENLYQFASDRHSEGAELESSRYPRYFSALERGRSVVAHDAHRDPDTSEFGESYLTPLGITSMLDAPVRRSGRLVGVVCHEHVGPRRVWAADEQDFAASIGDFVSLALEAGERRQAQQSFRSVQEELLRQDFQARRQIEFELEQTRDELVRQTRLATIGQVASSIAHELGGPFEKIGTAAAALRRRLSFDEPEWSEQLDAVEREVERARIAVHDLLEMSHGQEPTKERIDFAAVVRDCFRCVRSSDQVELRLTVDHDPFIVDADPGQLRQVMTNLMANSIEASTDRGRVTVEARRRGDRDEIVVKDSGSGIPPRLRDRIFEPLVTTKAQGAGIGLAVCRQIVERHGGAIDVVAAPGVGAAFRVRLPRRSAGRRDPARRARSAPQRHEVREDGP